MARKSYACECMFNLGYEGVKKPFGKTVLVFGSVLERDEYVQDKDQKKVFAISQKEAYYAAGIKKTSTPCVYKHASNVLLNVLADVKQCYGGFYQLLSEMK